MTSESFRSISPILTLKVEKIKEKERVKMKAKERVRMVAGEVEVEAVAEVAAEAVSVEEAEGEREVVLRTPITKDMKAKSTTTKEDTRSTRSKMNGVLP